MGSDGFGGRLTGASSGVDSVLTQHSSSSRFASSSTTLPSSSSRRPPYCPPSKIPICRISWCLMRNGSYAIAARENPRNRRVLVGLRVEEPKCPRHSCLGLLSSNSNLLCVCCAHKNSHCRRQLYVQHHTFASLIQEPW